MAGKTRTVCMQNRLILRRCLEIFLFVVVYGSVVLKPILVLVFDFLFFLATVASGLSRGD